MRGRLLFVSVMRLMHAEAMFPMGQSNQHARRFTPRDYHFLDMVNQGASEISNWTREGRCPITDYISVAARVILRGSAK